MLALLLEPFSAHGLVRDLADAGAGWHYDRSSTAFSKQLSAKSDGKHIICGALHGECMVQEPSARENLPGGAKFV